MMSLDQATRRGIITSGWAWQSSVYVIKQGNVMEIHRNDNKLRSAIRHDIYKLAILQKV